MRAGSNLSILKEAKKNYMAQFIFSRRVGAYLLIPFFFFCGLLLPYTHSIVFIFLSLYFFWLTLSVVRTKIQKH